MRMVVFNFFMVAPVYFPVFVGAELIYVLPLAVGGAVHGLSELEKVYGVRGGKGGGASAFERSAR